MVDFKKHMLKKIKDDTAQRWNLYTRGVSPSFLVDFMKCKQTTLVRWVDGWKPRKFKAAPAHGIIGHDYLKRLHMLTQSGKKVTGKTVAKLSADILADYKKENKLLSAHDDALEMLIGQHEVVLPEYIKYYPADFSGEVQWSETEERFNAPYIFEDGKKTKLTGFKDAVFLDRKGTGIEETKHKGQISVDNLESMLPYNLQVMFYAHCIFMKSEFKDNSVRIHFNVIRRTAMKQGETETLAQFLARLQKDVRKRPDHYFTRLEMEVTRDESLEWQKEFLHPIMEEVQWWWNDGKPERRSYINTEELVGQYGKSDFFDLLTHQDYSHYTRKEAKPSGDKNKNKKQSAAVDTHRRATVKVKTKKRGAVFGHRRR